MKLKILAASMALAFSSVGAQTTSTWETSEYLRSRALSSVKASSAYARGWTGKGTTIAILDSGIDASLPEFQNKIVLARDFSNSGGIFDRVGHGTHVAGISAAAKNGQGMHGVAFEANLMIGKITNSGLVINSTVLQGAQWASSMGADVANLSLNFTLSQSSLAAAQIAPGIYQTKFTNTGNLPGGLSASQWASAVNSDMVLVVAAGNDATPWNGGLSQMATATDSSGKLLLGGRMIIAGNWNSQGVLKNGVTTYSMGPNSNGAAHLCIAVVNNVCQDKFKSWEFYLLAPGTGIYSTYPTALNKTGYTTMTGTSMAAPTISGGVALIRQMWPQMTGANTVKLLLVTADKNLPGYNMYTMGQGMMDLEKATRPFGTIGIPTTGRLSGARTSANPLLVTGGSASTGGLGNVMIVDDFERDFYVKSNVFTARQTLNQITPNQMAMPYLSGNGYSLFNSYTDFHRSGSETFEVKMFRNNQDMYGPSMLEATVIRPTAIGRVKFSGGVFTESMTWLGNAIPSFQNTGINNGSTTKFAGVGYDQNFDNGSKLYANITHGITNVRAHSENVKNIGPALSYTWNLGVEHTFRNKHGFGMMVYQPVTVYRANAEVDVPVGLDENFNIIRQTKANLAADVKEYRAGIYHKFSDKDSVNTMAFIETRQNYRGQSGTRDTAVGITARMSF